MKIILVSQNGIRTLAETKDTAILEEGKIACGSRHGLIILSTAAVSFGDNSDSQLGRGIDFDKSLEAKPVLNLPHSIQRGSAGSTHSVAVDDLGRVFTWGGTPLVRGRLGPSNVPSRIVKGLEDSTIYISEVGCGEDHTIVLDRTGRAYGWGNADHGRLGLGTAANQGITRPILLHLPGNASALSVACGARHSLILTVDLRVFSTGASPANGMDVECHQFTPIESLCLLREKDPVRLIACGDTHTLVATGTRVLAFGDGSCGKLGTGEEVDRDLPFPIDFPRDSYPVKKLCARKHHSMVLGGMDDLWVFGLEASLSHFVLSSATRSESAMRGPPTLALPRMFSRPVLADAVHSKVLTVSSGDDFCILVLEEDLLEAVSTPPAQMSPPSTQKQEQEQKQKQSLLEPPLPGWLDVMKNSPHEYDLALLSSRLLKEERARKHAEGALKDAQDKLQKLPLKFRHDPGLVTAQHDRMEKQLHDN